MNAEPFLTDVEQVASSGRDLRNEPAFHALLSRLENASRMARTNERGEISLVAAVDWNALIAETEALAKIGRDIRLLVIVARAWTHVDGLQGLKAGLEMLTRAIDTYWADIHPALKDGPDAVLRRTNALLQIENDRNGLLGDVRMMVVLKPRGFGPIRVEELVLANVSEHDQMAHAPRGLSDKEQEKRREAHAKNHARVTGALHGLKKEEPEELSALEADFKAALDALTELERVYADKCGATNGSSCQFRELSGVLAGCAEFLGTAAENEENAKRDPDALPLAGAPAFEQAKQAPGTGGSVMVNSRSDVENYLDMIIEFYERTEPASPIPHLARRMRRMVQMDFIQLMEEVAPSGMKEFRTLAGVPEKGEQSIDRKR